MSRDSGTLVFAEGGTRGKGWLSWLAYIIPAVTALCVALIHGPFLIDDAYITFRYAENLATGEGLVFNRGEPVLGTTSPLLAVLLAFLKLIGLEIPLAARWVGLVSGMAVVVITQMLAARVMQPLARLTLGLCLAFHPDLAIAANSGMETAVSMAVTYAVLLMALQGRYTWAGALGGVAFLLRPDGALVVLMAVGVTLCHHPRRIWRPLLAAGLVTLPWLIYAAVTYDGWIPQSIPAKQLIHPDTPGHILLTNLRRLSFGVPMKLVCGLAVGGMVLAVVRRSKLVPLSAWMLLYLAGLSASRIMSLFPWYVTPLLPGLLVLAAYCVEVLIRALSKRVTETSSWRPWVERRLAAAILLILAVLLFSESPTWYDRNEAQFGRVPVYLQIGDLLGQRCRPGDAVLVGEVGALAYALPEQFIIDSSGINSPAVLRARKEDRSRLLAQGVARPSPEGSPQWVLELVDRFEPRYIVTYRPWLHVQEIMSVPEIARAYRRVGSDIPGLEHYFILERREIAPAGQ